MNIFKGIALTLGLLLALGVLWLLLVASHWLPRPTEDEQQAIALLNSDAAKVHGKANAFAALYLLDREVPESEWEAIAAADSEILKSHSATTGQPELAAERYPRIAELTGAAALPCHPRESDCLAQVRADMGSARAAVDQLGLLLDRGERLARFDFYRSPVTVSFGTPFPLNAGSYASAALTEAALLHAEGNSSAGLEKLCTLSTTWRRLRANSESLIINMLGTNLVGGAVALRADILAELPATFVPPCPEAFAPLTDQELDLCPSMADEFRMLELLHLDINKPGKQADDAEESPWAFFGLQPFNFNHANRLSALSLARYCQPPHRQRAAERIATPLPESPSCSTLAWTFSAMACAIVPIGAPNFVTFYHRVLDLDTKLRLLATAQWLRQQPADNLELAFANRPDELRSPTMDFEIDTENQRLRTRLLGPSVDAKWEIPYATNSAVVDDNNVVGQEQ